MLGGSLGALIVLGFVLGLRHGIDWDHIAAITDITSSTTATTETTAILATAGPGLEPRAAGIGFRLGSQHWNGAREGFFLATLYALGHAIVVALLGLLAIWAGAILPAWIDPLMERVVGVTLLLLGGWIFYSLWRHGRAFRLQSRWMLLFSILDRAWKNAKSRVTGKAFEHSHEVAQYGSRTAFGIGMIHGVGAETGSQALLLAGAAGATTQQSGSLMLLAFVAGLVISNSVVAAFSAFGFVSASVKRNVYLAVGVIAGIFSLLIGAFFVLGQGAGLPDLQHLIDMLLAR